MTALTPEQIANRTPLPATWRAGAAMTDVLMAEIVAYGAACAREAQTTPQYVIIRGGLDIETSEHVVVLDLDLDGCDLWAGEQLLATAEELLAAGAPVQKHVENLREWVGNARADSGEYIRLIKDGVGR